MMHETRSLPANASAGFVQQVESSLQRSWQRIDYVPEALPNGKVPATELLAGVAQGPFLLFDLDSFGLEWLDELSRRKRWFVCRLREQTTFTVLHTSPSCEDVFAGVVWLGPARAQAGEAVRLLRLRVGALSLT